MNELNVFRIVVRCTVDVLGVAKNDIPMTGSLSDLGANSIDRVEIVTACLEELRLSTPLVAFSSVTNIEDLVRVLHRLVATSEQTAGASGQGRIG